jgi:phosphinothricin acetyltransferase
MNKINIFEAPKKLDTHILHIEQYSNNIQDVAKEILEIYAPFITNTTVTFEYKIPSLQDFTNRIISIANEYPYLVYEKDGKILGYAYASKYHIREAYKFSVDLSLYVHPSAQGQGIGTALYDFLCTKLQEQGFRTAYSLITSPNLPSENFHKKYGFTTLTTFKNCGYKFDKWIDVKFMQLQLNEYSNNPQLEKKNILNNY